ncbi:MAG: hypothetical protein GAK45_02381 [Pseudomonas citronellolis]|nr:MAG: hypothetical protein GAK45_02381 [Pseudomonas citronellolis]
MHPELVQQGQRCHGDEYQRRHADQGQRQIEDPREEKAAAGLAQGGGEVVLLALVMHRMRRPQHVAFMAHAVQPVVAEVVEHERQQPDPERTVRQAQQGQVLPGQRVAYKPDALGQQPRAGRQRPSAQAVDRIGQAIVALPAQPVGDQLHSNQHEEERHGQQNQVHGDDPKRYPQRLGRVGHNPYGHICQTRGHLAPRHWSNEHDEKGSGDSFRLWRV